MRGEARQPRLRMSSIFQTAASFYADFRVPYPKELMARVVAECGLDRRQRLLDLGCGTGEVFLRLLPHLSSVVAVDPDPDMLEHAKRKAARRDSSDIRFVQATAEEIDGSYGVFDLVTAGASFHWMDRDSVARTIARDLLVPGGTLVILGSTSLWHGEEPWHGIVCDVIRHWCGENRRAGTGLFQTPSEPHQTTLERLGYAVDETMFEVDHKWSARTLLGYLYSTSFASPGVLAGNRNRFEADLMASLLAHDHSGQYYETLRFHLILARPPSA